MRDLDKLVHFMEMEYPGKGPGKVTLQVLKEFVSWLNKTGMSPRSQARLVSALKAFFKYLLLENIIESDPSELLDSPRTGRKLPDFLG